MHTKKQQISVYHNLSLSELKVNKGEPVMLSNSTRGFPSYVLLVVIDEISRGYIQNGIHLNFKSTFGDNEEQWTLCPKGNILKIFYPLDCEGEKIPKFVSVDEKNPIKKPYNIKLAFSGEEAITKAFGDKGGDFKLYADLIKSKKLVIHRNPLEKMLEYFRLEKILQPQLRFRNAF